MHKLGTYLPPVAAFVLAVWLAHLHVLAVLDRERREAWAGAEAVCAAKAREAARLLDSLVRVTGVMGGLLALDIIDESRFPVSAGALLAAYPGVESVGIAPEGVLAFIHPRRGHEQAIGADLLREQGLTRGGAESARTHASVLSGPERMASGQDGFLARTPVYTGAAGGEAFWGFATAVMSVEALVNLSGLEALHRQGYLYRLEKAGGEDGFQPLAGTAAGGNAAEASLQMSGVRLRLLVEPMAGADSPGRHLWVYGFALAAGAAVGFWLHRTRARPLMLAAKADRKAAALKKSNACLSREVKARKLAADELQAAGRFARDMFENSPAVKLLVDPMALTVVDANPAAERFYGHTRQELSGKPIAEINASSPEEIGRAMARAVRGMGGPFAARHALASGEVRDVEIYSGPVRKSGKTLLHSTVVDVTGRGGTQARPCATLDAVMDGVDAAILLFDAEGRIRTASRGFAGMFETTPDAARGLSLLDLTHPGDREASRAMHAALKPGQTGSVAVRKRFLRANGESFWGQVTVTPLPEGQGAGSLAVITDLTALLEAQEAANAADAAKSRFLAAVNHEIRTPLNALMGLTELTLKEGVGKRQRTNLEKALDAGRTLLGVVQSLLDCSSLADGRVELVREPFRLEDVLDAVRERFGPPARAKGLRFRAAGEGLPGQALLGDAVRLEQVLANLTDNAVKFTANGEVAVAARSSPKERGQALVTFTVADTGPGLTPEEFGRLRQPFAQADASLSREHCGMGLGLFAASELVTLMGGELSARPTPGGGLTAAFSVVLPVVSEDRAQGLDDLMDMAELTRGLKVAAVLVVDDNPYGRDTASAMLSSAGMGVTLASSGPQALEAIGRERFDAVLLDLQMPGMDGFETFRAIRALEQGKDLPVIAFTGRVLNEDRRRCFEAGMNDYLEKPLSPAALFAALRQINPGGVRKGGEMATALNSAKALTLLLGNTALYARLLGGFTCEYGDAAARMRELVDEGRMSEGAILAHSIKGLAANLGGEILASAAFALEIALREGDAQKGRDLLPAFIASLEEFSALAGAKAAGLAGRQ
jgi:PAS domain S-box-containing protein